MTMEKFMLWLATAATLFVAVPTLAAQDDPRLRELFDKLAVTDDDREGELIQAAIWTLWLNSGDPRTDALMMRGIQAIDGMHAECSGGEALQPSCAGRIVEA